jgi:elongation factor G
MMCAASPPWQKRLGVKPGNGATAQVLKTFHTAQGGKLSLARVLSG